MMRTDGVELRQVPARWMRLSHLAASLLAATAVLISPAGLAAKLLMLGALPVVHFTTARRARRAAEYAPRIRLFEDGGASILTRSGAIPASLRGGAWSSRWFSVIRLTRLDGQGRLDCIICRSANSDDAYRRLRVMLRLGSGQDAAAPWRWQ